MSLNYRDKRHFAALLSVLPSVMACRATGSESALARSHVEAELPGSVRAESGRSVTAPARALRSLEVQRNEERGDGTRGDCARGMVSVEGRFCIDRYEATLVDVLPGGEERAHSPFSQLDSPRLVRAVSAPDVFPQGYISAVEAQRACTSSGKRLCLAEEWGKACRGPDVKSFGYGDQREPGRCNDTGRSPILSLYGRGRWGWSTMNQPILNQQDGTLSRTGEHGGCTNGYGVYDMVGNLHEWVADSGGTFYGGYYQDVASVGHGEGCGYQTSVHGARYHDYSTGFRCCADVPVASPRMPPAARAPRSTEATPPSVHPAVKARRPAPRKP